MSPLLTCLLLLSPSVQTHAPDQTWEAPWRQVYDRTGRPDPTGPIQQRFGDTVAPELSLDLDVSAFPLRSEHCWDQADHGARLWVQSLDEFTLANQVQAKTRSTLGDHGHFDLAYHRTETPFERSDLVQTTFGHGDTRAGWHGTLTLYPRWEKDDSDVEFTVGHAWPGLVAVRARIAALDPFTNASLSLAESRDADLEVRVEQEDLPLVGGVEVNLGGVERGWRAQLHAGGILPHTTLRTHRDEPALDRRIRTDGALLDAWFHWHPRRLPLSIGLGGHRFFTRHRKIPLDETGPSQIDETTSALEALVVASWTPRLHVESRLRRTWRPEVRKTPTGTTRHHDREWLWTLDITGALTDWTGIEVGVQRVDRDVRSDIVAALASTDHRLVTRWVLHFGQFWASVGTGWDLDRGDTLYDGSGVVIMADW